VIRKILNVLPKDVVDIRNLRYEPSNIYIGRRPEVNTWFFLRRSGNGRFYFYSFHAEGEIYPAKGEGYTYPIDTLKSALDIGWQIWELRSFKDLKDLLVGHIDENC